MPDQLPLSSISPRALVCNDGGKYLFLQRSATSSHWPGTWEPPGGKMDPGESVDVTIAREALEESGLQIRDLRVAGATEGAVETARFVVLLFEATAEPGEVRLSNEHDAFRWVTPAEAAELDLTPIYQQFIQSWAASKSA